MVILGNNRPLQLITLVQEGDAEREGHLREGLEVRRARLDPLERQGQSHPDQAAEEAEDDGKADASGLTAQEVKDGVHYRKDASGRRYKYDKWGNRIFAKPLHGSLRPASIPLKEWQKLGKKTKKLLHDMWLKLEADRVKAETKVKDEGQPLGKTKSETKSPSLSAAACRVDALSNEVQLSSQDRVMMLTVLCSLMSGVSLDTKAWQALCLCFLRLSGKTFKDRCAKHLTIDVQHI